MRIIALEEHFTTPGLEMAIDALGSRSGPSGLIQHIQSKLLDLGMNRISDMDAGGIDLQVLSLTAFELERFDSATATALVVDANDVLAEAVNAHPTRFAGFAALNLREPEAAARELVRTIDKLGFKGVLVHGTTDGLFLDDRRFTPFWQAAESLDVPVYLHPAPPPKPVERAYFSGLSESMARLLATAAWGWHVETGLHVLRLIVSGLFDRHPGLQVIIGHMGENLPFSLARAEGILQRAEPKLPRKVADYFRENIVITTSGYFTLPPFQCAMEVAGVDRILFSVDYPYSSNETGKQFLDSLPVSSEDLHKIAHGNAERILKLKP